MLTLISYLVDEFKNALSTNTSADDFKRKYGHNKPGLNDRIITTCRSGRRARLATRMAEELGYTKLVSLLLNLFFDY